MAESRWPRHALRIARFEFRRSFRSMSTARIALLALAQVIPSLLIGGLAYVFAGTLSSSGSIPIPNVLRGSIALFWLFGTYIVGQRVATKWAHADAESLMLTTVSSRTVAVGLVAAETLRGVAYLAFPTVVITGVVTVVYGSPVSLLFVPAAVVLFVSTSVATGTTLGYLAVWLGATVRLVARHRTVFKTVVVVVAMGGYMAVQFQQVGFVSRSSLAWLPMGWFADFAAVGSPLTGSAPRAVGALVGGLLVVAIGLRITDRETTALWFSDPVSVDGGDERSNVASEESRFTSVGSTEPTAPGPSTGSPPATDSTMSKATSTASKTTSRTIAERPSSDGH